MEQYTAFTPYPGRQATKISSTEEDEGILLIPYCFRLQSTLREAFEDCSSCIKGVEGSD